LPVRFCNPPAHSLERVGAVDRAAVASLGSLKALTGLTVITAADAADHGTHFSNPAAAQQLQQQQQQQGEGAEAAVAPAHAALDTVAAAAGSAVAGGVPAAFAAVGGSSWGSSQGMWLPLLELPMLQEVVMGSAHRSQQLNLTGSLAEHLHSNPDVQSTTATPASSNGGSSGPGSSGGSSGSSSWQRQAGEAVSVYVCPTGAWSDMADVKVGQHMQGIIARVVRAVGGVQRMLVLLLLHDYLSASRSLHQLCLTALNVWRSRHSVESCVYLLLLCCCRG
jgi:hypothetical protein